MSAPEIPLQAEMFSGQLVDNRTTSQKRHDNQRNQPQQIEMFRAKEIAQFGVNPHPLLPRSPYMKLWLIREDPRTAEEIERDLQREAEEKTFPLFPTSSPKDKFHFRVRPPIAKPLKYTPTLLKVRPIEKVQAKPETFLAPPLAIAVFKTFEEWLESELGREVQHRILNNRHAVPLIRNASIFDTQEDVQQKALIWLWQTWGSDPNFTQFTGRADCLSHAAGLLTKAAVWRANCRYAKRRRDGVEQVVEWNEDVHVPLIEHQEGSPATHVRSHDRPVRYTDLRLDIRQATDRVVERMLLYEQSKNDASRHPVPIGHITRTIIEGHLYHYEDRFSHAGNSGNFRRFCADRGVSKARIERWRPLIFQYLREELAEYHPVQNDEKALPEAAAAD